MERVIQLLNDRHPNLSKNSLYQVLVGRRTATTLFFAVENQVDAWLGVAPKLDKKIWLQRSQWTEQPILDEEYYGIFTYRLGTVPHYILANYQNAFLLLLQTLSYGRMKVTNYQPVTTSFQAQQLVKHFYFSLRKTKWNNKGEMAQVVHDELLTFFAEQPEKITEWYLELLVGYQVPAYTMSQMANETPYKVTEMSLLITAYFSKIFVHFLHTDSFLGHFFRFVLANQHPWNQSVEITYQFWQKGLTIEEISHQRRLKPSTINDHLMEIMLYFPNPFIKKWEQMFKQSFKDWHVTDLPNTFEEFRHCYGEKLPYWTMRLVKYYLSDGSLPLGGEWFDG